MVAVVSGNHVAMRCVSGRGSKEQIEGMENG